MAAVNHKGSLPATTMGAETLLNFCRTVLHCDELRLQAAMLEYEQALYAQRPTSKAA